VIFENNRDGIKRADLIVANLNGVTTDDGTAWELGYAAALGTPSIGVYTDWRSRFDGEEIINLMIGCSLKQIVRSLDDLTIALTQWQEM
jgi:nucleoside 2-deoxyribosyltransferase